jgi:hypothetical protein
VIVNSDLQNISIPEPGSALLLLLGVVAVGIHRRRTVCLG